MTSSWVVATRLLDGLGTNSIPDPTAAGDVCQRFDAALQEAVNQARLRVWSEQPASFFSEVAVIDADATILATSGEAKEGMSISFGVLGAPRPARQHQRTPLPGAARRQPAHPRGRGRLLRPGDRTVPKGRVKRNTT